MDIPETYNDIEINGRTFRLTKWMLEQDHICCLNL
jgi:hypothetical protein